MKDNRMDIGGQKYNRLTAIKFIKKDKHGGSIWECLCECGNTSYVRLGALRAGQVKQCSKCSNTDKISVPIMNKRIRNIYKGMKRRCYETNRAEYHRYGGRGISVCNEWLIYPDKFEEWSLLNGYSETLSIDRIDNNGNYEPSNCRWTDDKVQGNNRRDNRTIEHNGESLTVSQWAGKLNIDRTTIYNRIQNKESLDSVLNSMDVRTQKSKSGIKGISWSNPKEVWILRVQEDGKRLTIGTYRELENASYAKEKYESQGVRMNEKSVIAEIKRQMNNKK